MATIALSAGDDIQTLGHDAASDGDHITLPAGNYFSQSVNVTTDNLTFKSVGADAATDCAFDETGGASEDLWTSSIHGLSVGDKVYLSVGTGAAPYAANTDYWVVAVPSTTTFQLSATNGGAVLEGTGDSTSNWTLTHAGTRSAVTVYGGPQVTGFAVQGNGYYKATSPTNLNAVFDGSSVPWLGSSVTPRGNHKIMCTVDTDYYHHVGATADLGDTTPFGRAGNFYYDYTNDEVWLSSDPGAGIVVISTLEGAFYGTGDNITIKNMRVGCYQPNAQVGMLAGGPTNAHGTGWDLDDLKAFSSHGVGVQFRNETGPQILQNSLVTECGQLGCGAGIMGVSTSRSIDDVTDYNNEISYNNLKGFQPGHEAGGAKWAWVKRFSSSHSYYHHNLGPGCWLDINCVDYSVWWTIAELNRDGGIVVEVSGFGEVAENKATQNGGFWPNNAVGAWPSSDAGAWGTAGGIMIWESNGLYVWPGTVLGSPTGILVHDNIVDDNRGGIFLRGGGRDSDSSNPGGDAYHNTAIRVYDNNIWWDDAAWSNGEHNGSFDNNNGELDFTGAAENYFTGNDYSMGGTRTPPAEGWAWGNTMSFSQWQTTAGHDLTTNGAAAPSEPYGNIPAGSTIQPARFDATPTIFDPVVIQGQGDIAPDLHVVGITIFEPTLLTTAVDHIRINAGGPLITATPVAWEADGSADVAPGAPDTVNHEYNEDPTGSWTVSNYSGVVDVISDPVTARAQPPETLYHTERYDTGAASMTYVIRDRDPLLTYLVRVFASENYSGITGAGQRMFSVFVNGNVIKTDWDLYADSLAATSGGEFTTEFTTEFTVTGTVGTGLHVGLVAEALAVPDSNGDITITFSQAVQSALLNGLEVIAADRTITTTLIDATPTIFIPTLQISGELEISPDVFDASATIFEPVVIRQALEAVIETPLVDANVTVFTPTITVSEEVPVSTDLTPPVWADVLDASDATSTTPTSFSQARSASFVIGEADTAPYLIATLRNALGEALDLSATGLDAASVVFSMRNADTNTLEIDKAAAVWVDSSIGKVQYQWTSVDTTDRAGLHWAEFQVTLNDGRVITFPNQSPKIQVEITGELA